MNVLPQNTLVGRGVTHFGERWRLRSQLRNGSEMHDRVWGTLVRNNELFVGKVGASWRLGSDAKIVGCEGCATYEELSRPSLAPRTPSRDHSSGSEVRG